MVNERKKFLRKFPSFALSLFAWVWPLLRGKLHLRLDHGHYPLGCHDETAPQPCHRIFVPSSLQPSVKVYFLDYGAVSPGSSTIAHNGQRILTYGFGDRSKSTEEARPISANGLEIIAMMRISGDLLSSSKFFWSSSHRPGTPAFGGKSVSPKREEAVSVSCREKNDRG